MMVSDFYSFKRLPMFQPFFKTNKEQNKTQKERFYCFLLFGPPRPLPTATIGSERNKPTL